MTTRTGGLGAAALLALAGCGGGGDAAADWRVRVDTLATGAVRVSHEPPASGIEPTWVIEEAVRIGSLDGGGPASFGQIKGLAVDDAERIWVLDAQAQELRVFGPDGAYLRTVGRRGEGPGEFGDANGLMRAPDGRIWVVDPRLARMTVIDPDAGVDASHRWELRSWGFVWDGRFDADGRILERTSGEWNGQRGRMLRILDQRLAAVDSAPLEPLPPPGGESPGAYRWEGSGGMFGFFGIPFYATQRRTLTAMAAIWTTGDGDPSYRITRFVPGGDTTLVIESRRPTIPVTAAERDSAMAAIRESLSARGVDARFDWSRIPAVKPAISGLYVAGNGDLWVLATTPEPDRTTWDVYAPDGRYGGTAVLDGRFYSWVPPVIRGDRIWAVVRDELDVQYVVGGRLRAVGDEA